jgi:rsbT co-antagonist protein RsbR
MTSSEGPDRGAGGEPAQGESVEQLKAEIAALRARVDELTAERAGGARAEEERQQSHLLLAALVENSPSVIFMKDLEGRYLLLNQGLERMLQLDRGQILGATDFDLFSREAAEVMREGDQRALASAHAVQIEEVVQTQNGPRHFFTIKFPIRGARGELVGLCGVATDITDRKRDEAERAVLQEQVIAAQRIALQELSTPLVPIAAGVLAMPLVGTIDGARARLIMESLLDGIAAHGAHTAILDITGVRIVDTQVANGLVSAARAARLLGARVVLTGISPSVAQTLVQLGADLGGIATLSTLQAGIAHALAR